MSFATRSAWLVSGIVVWAAHFLAIYGFTALGCARDFGHAAPAAVVVAGVVAAALLAAIIARAWTRRAHFECWLSGAIAFVALVAVVYETVPAWAIPACA
ncbi:MAG: hypothetical protein LT106_15475 [Burkholderiaceae bacterium]|nr:hypothetical protein [Burkholderiaceae bacterium]